ncbi:unnamed protein product [Aphanomyces euteiches]
MQALSAFVPVSGKVVMNKVTGESRGFAFINFASIESAQYVVQYYAQQPLMIRGRTIGIGYSEPSRNQHYSAQPVRCDWLCHICNASNFAKRLECYKCSMPKSDYAIEVPRQNPEANNLTIPSHILAVRSLPSEAQEADLTQLFMNYPGMKEVRLVRDRATNVSRGFGFVEFASAEHATAALGAMGYEFYYGNSLVRLSYGMDSSHPVVPRDLGANAQALANAAVEAAQWSLYNSYKPHESAESAVDELLASASASVPTGPQIPRKEFPLSFEEAGGSFVYSAEFGLYYDTDSMFYYDPTSKVYYNSFLGKYHKYDHPSQKFEDFLPPLPVDDQIATETLQKKDSQKSNKKKVAISFGIKPSFTKPTLSATPLVTNHPVPMVSAVKKKHADEIAKWSQQQMSELTATPSTAQVAEKNTAQVAQPAICLLCRRKFNSAAQLRKHEELSDLHKQNLAKAKQTQQALRVKEPKESPAPSHYVDVTPPPVPVEVARVDKPLDDQSNIGGKMLKMMGWKSGEGLGKSGTGITAPVAAVGKSSGDTSGLGGNTLSSNPAVLAASSKRERVQQITRARFEGLNG